MVGVIARNGGIGLIELIRVRESKWAALNEEERINDHRASGG